MPSEYAKCKNRPTFFTIVASSIQVTSALDRAGESRAGNPEMSDNPTPQPTTASVPERKPLTPAAQRALAEAEARRQAAAANARPLPKELQGPKGPEPTRYGDLQFNGKVTDF